MKDGTVRDYYQTPSDVVHLWLDDGTESYACGVLQAWSDHLHTGPVTCRRCLRTMPCPTDSVVDPDTETGGSDA